MRRHALAVLVLAALAAIALPGVASAQSVFLSFGTGGGPPGSVSLASLRTKGAVTVDFHGDEASGCAAAGLCGVDGTVTWSPAGRGILVALGYREHGVRFEDGFFILADVSPNGPQPATYSRVRRAPAAGAPSSLCADVGEAQADAFGFGPRQGTSLEFGVLGVGGFGAQPSAALRTRCAGPMAADVSGLLPTHTISERALRRSPHDLDFSADREFAAGGLAGAVHSTVMLHIGRARSVSLDPEEPTGPTRKRRRRTLEVSYRVERVAGQVVTGVRGLADPDLCGPLDACGLMGSVTVAPRASSGEAIVSAEASARHPWRDLRRAVGLSPGRPPRGVSTFGFVQWAHDGGSVTSDLSRDGAPACTDSAPLAAGGAVILRFSSRAVRAAYGDVEGAASELMSTRCPGPVLADASGGGALASAQIPLRTFGSRQVTLRLQGGRAYNSDGYSGTTRPDVTVVMHRTRVKRRTQVYEVPERLGRVLARIAP